MKLLAIRNIFTINSTISKFYVDGTFMCYILEPFDRGLTDEMTIEEIAEKKIFAHTAIPTGTYDLKLIPGKPIINRFPWITRYYSADTLVFPELQNVKGFEGVLIHPGNYPKDTEGCSLVGMSIAGADFIGDTPDAFVKLQKATFEEIAKGDVTYEIRRDEDLWNFWQTKQASDGSVR